MIEFTEKEKIRYRYARMYEDYLIRKSNKQEQQQTLIYNLKQWLKKLF